VNIAFNDTYEDSSVQRSQRTPSANKIRNMFVKCERCPIDSLAFGYATVKVLRNGEVRQPESIFCFLCGQRLVAEFTTSKVMEFSLVI